MLIIMSFSSSSFLSSLTRRDDPIHLVAGTSARRWLLSLELLIMRAAD